MLSVINIALYLVLIIVIYFLLLKVTGHSPIFETIVITLVIGLVINMYRYEFILGKFIGDQEEFKDNVKDSFHNLKNDIQELKKKKR